MKKKNNVEFSNVVCDSKVKFSSEELVSQFIFMSGKQGVLDYYLCKGCNEYHTYTIEGKKKLFEKRRQKDLKKQGSGLKKMKTKTSRFDFNTLPNNKKRKPKR